VHPGTRSSAGFSVPGPTVWHFVSSLGGSLLPPVSFFLLPDRLSPEAVPQETAKVSALALGVRRSPQDGAGSASAPVSVPVSPVPHNFRNFPAHFRHDFWAAGVHVESV